MPPPGRQTSLNQRRASSEVDIDGGLSESEPANENSRMAQSQSDEIVKQLEKSVPRWEGFGPGGWSTTIQMVRLPLPYPWHLSLLRSIRQTRYRLLSKYGSTRTQGLSRKLSISIKRFQLISTAGRDSAPSWMQFRIWVRNSTSHKMYAYSLIPVNDDSSQ